MYPENKYPRPLALSIAVLVDVAFLLCMHKFNTNGTQAHGPVSDEVNETCISLRNGCYYLYRKACEQLSRIASLNFKDAVLGDWLEEKVKKGKP